MNDDDAKQPRERIGEDELRELIISYRQTNETILRTMAGAMVDLNSVLRGVSESVQVLQTNIGALGNRIDEIAAQVLPTHLKH